MKHSPIVVKGEALHWQNTRRPGIKERKLLSSDESSYQNIVVIEAEKGTEVEMHEIKTSESIYILNGSVEVIFPDSSIQVLEAGDFCHFHPHTAHGLRFVKEASRMVVVFAPPSIK